MHRLLPCLGLLQRAAQIDPNLKGLPFYFLQAHYYCGDYAEAWRHVSVAESRGWSFRIERCRR